MTHVIERERYGVLPDDPARTDTPEGSVTPNQVAQMVERHFFDIQHRVYDVIECKSDRTTIGGVTYDRGELWELIINEQLSAAEKFAAIRSRQPYSSGINILEAHVDAWCHRKAKELAEKELI